MSKRHCNVIMLHTGKKAKKESIILRSNNEISRLSISTTNYPDLDGWCKEQHLYIISDDAGKTDDWCFELYDEYASDLVRYPSDTPGKSWYLRKMNMNWAENDPACKKIIASTDPELTKGWIKDNDPERLYPDYVNITTMRGLPDIPKSFINTYISAYNRRERIKVVDVEYERWILNVGRQFAVADDYCITQQIFEDGTGIRLKVSLDNTINISQIKDNWNRSEVIKLLNKSHYDRSGNPYIINEKLQLTESWINENL